MPKIWRVQNKNGDGPYHAIDNNNQYAKQWWASSLTKHGNNNCHPSPMFDAGINRSVNFKEICGFKTEEQARKWFSKEELQWLESFGFYLQEIEVDVITAIGEYQVLAIKNLQNVDELNFCLP